MGVRAVFSHSEESNQDSRGYLSSFINVLQGSRLKLTLYQEC